jgi:hypothetical protein
VNRELLFDVAHARDEYLVRAAKAFGRTDWTPLGYALMSSHVHWLVRAGADSSDRLVRSLHVGFARWLNRAAGRLGPVFADRHRNVECESATALVMLAYIHNNPVRGGVVTHPCDSTWTSHRAYVGAAEPPAWLDVSMGLSLCGFEPNARGRAMFNEAIIARAGEPRRAEFTGANLQSSLREARSRHSLPVEIASPRVGVADAHFEQRIELIVPASCPARPSWSAGPHFVLREVARATGVSEADLRSRSRTHRVAGARRQTMLVWVHGLSRPAIEMARALGISSTAASDYLRRSSKHEREEAYAIAHALLEQQPRGRTTDFRFR